MDLGRLFRRAVQLTWQHKIWWLLGALLGGGAIFSAAARVWLPAGMSAGAPAAWLDVETWLSVITDATAAPVNFNQLGLNAAGLATAVFLLALAFWLLATVAEGTIITAVLHPTQPFQNSFRHGVRLLGRFIAIDALVFLPWFLLALAGMLWLLLTTLGAAVVSLRGGGDTAVFLLAFGWLCWLPLACLLLPVGVLSVVYRRLAFRDAALGERGVRAAVRHTWQVIRRHAGVVILLTLLLWGVTTLPVTAVNLIIWPLLLLDSGPLAAALRLATFLLSAGLIAMLHTLAATVWTLAYAEMIGDA